MEMAEGLSVKYLLLILIIVSTKVIATERIPPEFYASLRFGLDYLDTDSELDSLSGKDYLSRAGVKSVFPMENSLQGVFHLEYGLKSKDNASATQGDDIALRLMYAGVSGHYGEVYYGSQTLVWHSFVRSSYFSDTNDSLRQGTIRDDDLLQYFYQAQDFRLAAAAQFEGREGDNVDQWQLAGEYETHSTKWQVAYLADNQGENTGGLIGARLWWYPSASWTLSSYWHNADKHFDIYAGSTTGSFKKAGEDGVSLVRVVPSCVEEDRYSAGFYGKKQWSRQLMHFRFALDECEESGPVSSMKMEYVFTLFEGYKIWLSGEQIENSRAEDAESEKHVSQIQIGLRLDI